MEAVGMAHYMQVNNLWNMKSILCVINQIFLFYNSVKAYIDTPTKANIAFQFVSTRNFIDVIFRSG